jgi:hypothetical protein
MQHLRTALIGGGIGTAGDLLLQYREGRTSADVPRTARLGGFRLLHAPVIDACWRVFDRRFAMLAGARGVAARVVADQALLMPPSLVAFFISQSAMEGLSPADCVARTRDSFWPTFCICLPYWSAMHCITFAVFPPHLRMAWASVAAVVWSAIASNQNQEAIRREERAEEQR